MEEKFYLDDFELSLKEHADHLKMVPSKKVWHGIYNDLHPGRRWPSVMVSLLLIFSIVFVGYINTGSDEKVADSPIQTPLASVQDNIANRKSDMKNVQSSLKEADHGRHNNDGFKNKSIVKKQPSSLLHLEESNSAAGRNNFSQVEGNSIANRKNQAMPSDELNRYGATHQAQATDEPEEYQRTYSLNNLSNKVNTPDQKTIITKNTGIETVPVLIKNSIQIPFSSGFKTPVIPNADEKINNPISSLSYEPTLDNEILLAESDLKSNVAGTENAATALPPRKRNSKISWMYYASPYVSSASLNGEPLKESLNSNPSLPAPLPQITRKDMSVIRNVALNFEAGVQMNYLIASNFSFTTGAHITRSGYNIVSNLIHPTLSSLVLRNPSTGDTYSRSFVTHYGDGTGMSPLTLKNYSYQASVPVGLQYMVWDNDKLQVNVGANVEPSYIIKANAYMLSSDGKNYVNAPDLLREWNFSSNFAPFITFRSDKFKWNIGPSIRYQWLSTYKKNYPVKEHLIDYGIRIGISK